MLLDADFHGLMVLSGDACKAQDLLKRFSSGREKTYAREFHWGKKPMIGRAPFTPLPEVVYNGADVPNLRFASGSVYHAGGSAYYRKSIVVAHGRRTDYGFLETLSDRFLDMNEQAAKNLISRQQDLRDAIGKPVDFCITKYLSGTTVSFLGALDKLKLYAVCYYNTYCLYWSTRPDDVDRLGNANIRGYFSARPITSNASFFVLNSRRLNARFFNYRKGMPDASSHLAAREALGYVASCLSDGYYM